MRIGCSRCRRARDCVIACGSVCRRTEGGRAGGRGVQLLLVYMVTLLGLFGNFYISKHHAAAKTKKKNL